MPTVSAMMLSARRTERTPEGGGGVGKTARFHPDTACGGLEAGLEEDSGMDYSDVNDYWFDWVQLDKAEAKARSRSMPASRSREGARSLRTVSAASCNDSEAMSPPGQGSLALRQAPTPARARGARARATPPRRSGGVLRRGARAADPPSPAPVDSDSSEAGSDSDSVQAADHFRVWLGQRPSMHRLSLPDRSHEQHMAKGQRSLDTGRAWDFPLAKSEKRELLLQHIAAGERMAEDHAAEAERDAEIARAEQHRQRQSLESYKTARSRLRRKKARRRSSLTRGSVVGS